MRFLKLKHKVQKALWDLGRLLEVSGLFKAPMSTVFRGWCKYGPGEGAEVKAGNTGSESWTEVIG